MNWFLLFTLIAPTLLLGVFAKSSGKCISKLNDCALICPGVGHLDLTDLLIEKGAPRVFHLLEADKEFTVPQCFQSESKSSVLLEWSIDAENNNPYLIVDFVHAESVTDPSSTRVLFKCSDDYYVKSVDGVAVVGSPEVSSMILGDKDKASHAFSALSPCTSPATESTSVVQTQSKRTAASPTLHPTRSPSHVANTYYNNYFITNPYDYNSNYIIGYYNDPNYNNYNNYDYPVDYSFTYTDYYKSFNIGYWAETMAYSGTILAAVSQGFLYVYYCYPDGNILNQVALYNLPYRQGYYNDFNPCNDIAIDGDMIVVSYYDCVFTFTYDGALYQSAPVIIGPSKSWFGYGVALSSTTLMVFVYNMSSSGSWSLIQTLTGPEDSCFGCSVSMSNDLAMIGAPNANVVYAFQRSVSNVEWVLISTLSAPEAASDFGTLITMDGNTAFIATENDDGFIYSYLGTWNYQNPYYSDNSSSVYDLSLSGTILMILGPRIVVNYRVIYSDDIQLTPTTLPTGSNAPSRRPTYSPTVSPTEAIVYGVILVQELVGMSASTYYSKTDGNNQIFIEAVTACLGPYIDSVTILSVEEVGSSRRLLRSSGSKEEQSVSTISITYEVLIYNSNSISADYSQIYNLAYSMQSSFPLYLFNYGSAYYSTSNSFYVFGTYPVTSSSLTYISSVYLYTDDDYYFSSSSSSSKGADSTVIIAAAVGGGGGCILLIVVCVLYYWYCHRKHTRALVPVEETSGVELKHPTEMAPPLTSVDPPVSYEGYVITASNDLQVL